MKKRFLFSVLICLISNCTFAQQTDIIETPKNTIYATGSTLLLINEISLNYDVLLKEKEKGFFKRYYSHFEVGSFKFYRFLSGSSSGISGSVGFIGLTGKKRKHFEVGLEASIYAELRDSDNNENSYVFPSISFGYRYEGEKGFVFRTGLGTTKGVYTSFGYSF